ncbi:MAG: dienelactone hydrolase family protein [Sulfuricaulis sp.]|nr:dienelactone hydrolase family protein [Sulfuricaulis sp.]
MRKFIFVVLTAFIGLASAQAAIKGEPIEYKSNGTVHKGFLVYDDAIKGKRPGVLVVPEWWGHNEHTRNSARKLAELGYTALTVDMYGDGITVNNPDDAKRLSGELRENIPLAQARFDAAFKQLQKHVTVNSKKIAAIGSSFGCFVVLEMARIGEDLKGAACFTGNLSTRNPAKLGKVKSRVLVLNGAEDPFVPAEQIAAFKKEMETAKVNYKFVNYPGAKHSFTNPDADAYAAKFKLPLAYNAKVDQESWAELQSFLKSVFN